CWKEKFASSPQILRKRHIFIGLRDDYGEKIANYFATNPNRWLDWISRIPNDRVSSDITRRVILRKCYLNPAAFSQFRIDFVRAAFEVVDCPSLTAQGKSSADIHMVLDIIDALEQKPTFEEFILMSADSDFSPVLLRLRRFDRRLMVITPSDASKAYTQIADTVIESDDFVTQALEAHGLEGNVDAHDQHRLRQLAEKLEDSITRNDGSILRHQVHSVFKNEADFAESNWYGFYSSIALVNALVSQNRRLVVVRKSDEPWSVELRSLTVRSSRSPDIVEEIDQFIKSQLSLASQPISGASLAHTLQQRFPRQTWFGFPNFGSFIEDSVRRIGLKYDKAGSHDVIWDPERHQPPPIQTDDSSRNHLIGREHTDLHEFVQRLHRNYNIPPLRSRVYCRIFEVILESVSSKGFFHVNTTSKHVRDRLVTEGYSVSRKAIHFILRGLQNENLNFEEYQSLKAIDLATRFSSNISKLVNTSHVKLSRREQMMIEDWILPRAWS
ncbi:MAG: NYN domain-containing protein, partial [Bryobacterales bacterium]|nr:NYN domain-containing protein [Bryobacterales bacterium]